jgi:NADH:ubiquinone oxidoreductase subunit 2 (subunit N)
VTLSILLVPVELGRETAVVQAIARFVSLLLIVVAFNWLRQQRDGEGFQVFRGLGRREPLTAVVLAFGMVSLLGFPLTIGFIGRWMALTLIAQQPTTTAWLPLAILFAMGGGIYGVWRGIAPLLIDGPEAESNKPTWMRVALAAGLIGSIGLVVSTQVVLRYGSQLATVWLQAAS